MKNSVMFINFNDDFLLNFIYKVVEKNLINSIDVFTIKEKINIHSNINYHDINLLQGIDYIFNLNLNSTYILSKKDIETFYYLESEFLSESDRMSYLPISVKKRKQIYYEILQYWLNYFHNKKIDLVVFDGVPHMGWDLVCYEVAKSLNINVCYLELTIIQDQVIWNENYKIFSKRKIEDSKFTVEELKKKIKKENFSKYNIDGEILKLGKKLNEEVVRKTKIISKIKRIRSTLIMFIFANLHLKKTPFAYSKGSYIKFFLYYFQNKRYLKDLKIEYNKHVVDIDLNKKFVFFAMHYQPERTTSPQGECFQEQLLALKIISASLPKDWMLYVKEHPTQLNQDFLFWTNNFRNKNDYKMISRIKNVQFVSLDMDSKYLIEKAQIVSTINGSVGWETMSKYNKPIAIFGNIWYAMCNSCFTVSSVDDFKNVIENLNEYDENRVKKDVLNLFLHYQDIFFDSSDSDFYANYSPLSKDILLQNLVDNFLKKYID